MTSWEDYSLTLEVLIVNLRGSARSLPLLLNGITTFFNNLASWDWWFFSSHQQSNVENAKRY